MSDETTKDKTEETSGMSFGVTVETKSKNTTPFNPGFSKGYLTSVKKEVIGKTEKFTVLTFVFKDVESVKTHRHSEFMVKAGDKDFDKKMNGLNVRLKHIYEGFAKFPDGGIGVGAKSFEEFFDKVSDAFEKGANGKPIYQKHEEGKPSASTLVWLKLTYDRKDNLGFPLSPNFIERIGESNQTQPKTLNIDKKYDRLEQANNTASSASPMMGNTGMVGGDKVDDFGF